MFGASNEFGQSSNSPFGSPSVFGQTSNANNPFAAKPFGSTSPFGAQTGSSNFGGTSTGVFGTPASTPIESTSGLLPAIAKLNAKGAIALTVVEFERSMQELKGYNKKAYEYLNKIAPQHWSRSHFYEFGQSSNSPFGSPSVFGQTSNANNPFAAKPFGSTSPFGAQTGSSNFGGTSTGVFGTPASTPIESTSVFGASSSPAFGSSTPALGTSSSPAFGTALSSPFAGSSVSEQNPASDCIGFTTPSSPFGKPFQESGPAMREFGTPPLEASSETAFGATSTPASASSVTPAFGDSSTPASGSNSTPAFGSTGSAFGDSNSPFGSTTPALWTSPTPAYCSTGSSFSFASNPAFAHSPTPFGVTSIPVSPFSRSPFAAQSSPFGAPATTPAFGRQVYQPSMGSRVYSYDQTTEVDGGIGTQPAAKLQSISAMHPYSGKAYPLYSGKSHEELRWEDYQLGDKGGPNPASQSSTLSTPTNGVSTFSTPTNGFSTFSTPGFASSTHPFASAQSQPPSGFFSRPVYCATPSQPSFGKPNTSNPFWTAPAQIPVAYYPTSSNPFNTPPSRSLFGTPNTPGFGTPISIFGTTQAQGTTSSFDNGINPGTQSANLFQSSSPARGQTSSPFWQPAGSPFDQAAPYNVQSAPPFSQSNAFARTSTPITPSVTSPFQSAQVTQNPAGGIGGFNQSFEQMFTNLFGALQAMRQMSTTNLTSGRYIGPVLRSNTKELCLAPPTSSNSPFGSPSVFGQTNNANNNPFAAKPFGSTSPFGAQTGSSIFGGTSTGVFGTPASSPIGSTSVFGASSSPAFGSSTPAFGATSSPAFGAASSSPFGGSSTFGQKPAFGGFGSTPTSSPFGSSFSQSQPAFGSNQFGSSNFGAGSQSAFGVSSTPAFGVSSTPTFGVSSTPAFGTASTPAFGTTSTPAFGNTGSAFGVSNSPFGSTTPAFGVSSTPAFGVASTPAFGVSTTPTFGAASAPAFGSSPTTTFGASGSAFSFASTPAFGQSTSAFGSSQFTAQSSPFGSQATTPAFGTPNFGQPSFGTQQRAGSRATPYAQTPEADSGTGTQPAGKLESISAMPAYKEKSHEELRWEDYQAGDKGGPNPAGQSSGGMGFNTNNTQPNPFSSSPSFTQPAANPFSSNTSSTNPFAQKTSTFSTTGFASSTPTLNSSPFATPTNPFASTPAQTPSVFNTTSNPFGTQTTPSLFGTQNTSAFGTSTSIFGTTQAQGSTPSFGTGMNFGTQSANLFQSSSPALAQSSSPFAQTGSAFGQTGSAFGQSAPAFGQPNAFSGNMFSSTPSLQNTSNLAFNQTPSSVPFQSTQPTQNSGFGFGAPAGGIGGTTSIFGQNNNFGQMPTNQSPALAQPQTITNPFGTLPAMPQMSIGRVGNAPSIQYGISSLPVVDKPAPMRISSVLTSRHLSQSRIRLPARKYHPKNDSPKVSFFSDEEETMSTPKADALFIPRENPRALVIRPLETWPGKASAEKPKGVSSPAQTNGKYVMPALHL
ncbi:nucleoporin autopeptidase [Artemisia annua]|uniref:Nucleoporin autopeptidase n=1 Tax=Artemisia annua TaxID=35608 RepID=A0A2U1LCT2_ARTAN|nr:nucleoporin autopeptidase [Artemisia annua]